MLKCLNAFFNIIFLRNTQGADVNSMAAVETIGCRHGLFVTNNMAVLVVVKIFL